MLTITHICTLSVQVIFMAMLISWIFKTIDDMDDDKEAKKTTGKPREDEDMDIETLIGLSEYMMAILFSKVLVKSVVHINTDTKIHNVHSKYNCNGDVSTVSITFHV